MFNLAAKRKLSFDENNRLKKIEFIDPADYGVDNDDVAIDPTIDNIRKFLIEYGVSFEVHFDCPDGEYVKPLFHYINYHDSNGKIFKCVIACFHFRTLHGLFLINGFNDLPLIKKILYEDLLLKYRYPFVLNEDTGWLNIATLCKT